jgi:predicted amidohydrolase YtcJ
MSFANAAAMRLAGVDDSTADPAGGELLRDADGAPTGVFRETAQGLIGRYCDDGTSQRHEIVRAIQLAGDECLRKGVTSFQDAGSSFATIDLYRELAESGKLPVRLWVMVSESNSRLASLLPRYRVIGAAGNRLTVRAIKRLLDGALGAHGAWLLKPYDDLPSSRGLNTISIASLRRTAEIALENECQLCVHAIGDRANREVLDIFEAAIAGQPSSESRRWRVEHAQHLHPDDIPRFSQLGVIASMQGIHCTSDAAFVVQRLGRRRAADGAYAWQSLLRSGARISNGTDTPVEDVDPIACFYASVTRRAASGDAFFPEQRMTREQALRSYTLDAAYAAFEEDLKGSLSPGKLADVVVLSKDILTCPEDEIRTARVECTIVDGQVVYELK